MSESDYRKICDPKNHTNAQLPAAVIASLSLECRSALSGNYYSWDDPTLKREP